MIRYHTTRDILCQIVMSLGIIISSCGNPKGAEDNLSGYYYPVNKLTEAGTLYIYKNIRDNNAEKEVWRHRSSGDGLMESINFKYFDPSLNVDSLEIAQRQYDRIVSNGVMIDSLILYFQDSTGITRQQKANILSPHRFPFEPGDSTKVWLTHLEWWQPDDSLHVVLERRRRFVGDTIWEFEGKKIPAVKFITEDNLETEQVGWTSSTWTGVEIYAKNIGLMYYKRNISEQLSLEFELETVIRQP